MYEHYFLLDDSRFSFFRFDVFQDFSDKIGILDIDDIIKSKFKEVQSKTSIGGEMIMTYIDTIFVNGDSKKYLIGEKGEIFFRLYIICIERKTLNNLNSVYGNVLLNKKINIIPESLYTLLYLRTNLKKDNFVLLYITETYCKAISIKNGFYDKIEILNLGIGSLKQMYKDNGIVQYRYKDYDFIESNPLARGLVVETLQFYCQLFCKRFYEKNLIGTDVVVISSITKNTHFIEVFDKEYKKISNNYIVPFNRSDNLDYFDIQREPEDMDTLVLVNREDRIRAKLSPVK